MPRQPHPTAEWDTLESAYIDEFGRVAPDVYAAAGRLWPPAQAYATRTLADTDPARARTLLVKAAAQVTRARDEKSYEVRDLDGYLFQTFKRIVLAELEKDDNRRRFEVQADLQTEWQAQANGVERRILLHEIIAAMDDWTRAVFEWLTLDYTFDDIARQLNEKPKAVSNKFHRRIERLLKQMGSGPHKRDSHR